MPTYEYVCTSCQNHWEEVQKISEPPLEVCPKCSQNTAKRQISGGNFILKGGGWYADLYSSPGAKPNAAKGGEGKGEGAGGSESTSDAKSSGSKSDAAAPAPAKAEPSAKPAPAPPKGSS